MTSTATDVVTAQLAVFEAAKKALDIAQDFAGVPRTSDDIAALQAQMQQLTDEKQALQTQLNAANAANAALQGNLDTIRVARKAEEAGEIAADAARQQIDGALA